jgi:phosphohistidine swiveling domain-containing protein
MVAPITADAESTIGRCCPLSQSLFLEIYNEKMWLWYKEWGLVKKMPEEAYLVFKDNMPFFNEEVRSQAMNLGFLGQMKASMHFPALAAREIKKYDPEKINALYSSLRSTDFSKMNGEELLWKFSTCWDALVDNFRYAFLASLILQYRLHAVITTAYYEDIAAARYNAPLFLQQKKMQRKDFDDRFGHFSSEDYDFGEKRYKEQKEIPVLSSELVLPKPGEHNFREHVKDGSVKMIALIRWMLISYGGSKLHGGSKIFLLSKEEILKKENSLKQKKAAVKKGEVKKGEVKKVELKKNEKQALPGIVPLKKDAGQRTVLQGVVFNGKGAVEGRIKKIITQKDYLTVNKDDIIVTSSLKPDLVLLFSKVAAIIAERGGQLSHAAIVAREYGLPVIGNAEGAMASLEDGMRVRIDLSTGRIEILKKLNE